MSDDDIINFILPVCFSFFGSNNEFSGGFTSTGFFEAPQPVLVRGPAGSSTEDQTGQELRSGLTSVFY